MADEQQDLTLEEQEEQVVSDLTKQLADTCTVLRNEEQRRCIGHDVACVTSYHQGERGKPVDCTVTLPGTFTAPLKEGEQLVSALVKLHFHHLNDSVFPLLVGVPCVAQGEGGKVPCLKHKVGNDGQWETSPTCQQQHEGVNVAWTSFNRLEEDTLLLLVVLTLHSDTRQFNVKGGTLTSTTYPDVQVDVPMAAFPNQTPVTLKVQPALAIQLSREQHPLLQSASCTLHVAMANKPRKALQFSVPEPPVVRNTRPATSKYKKRTFVMPDRPVTAPARTSIRKRRTKKPVDQANVIQEMKCNNQNGNANTGEANTAAEGSVHENGKEDGGEGSVRENGSESGGGSSSGGGGGGGEPVRAVRIATRERPQTTTTVLPRVAVINHAKSRLCLVCRSASGSWHTRKDVLLETMAGSVTFEMEDMQNIDKLQVLRVWPEASDTNSMAVTCETLARADVAVMLLLHRQANLMQSYVDCVKASQLQATVAKLREDGYTEGPVPSKEVLLYEGQTLQINVTGNIGVRNLPQLPFTYCSHINTLRCEVELERKELSADVDVYRGSVAFVSVDGTTEKPLCSLPVTLPRERTEPLDPLAVPIHHCADPPLTNQYISLLALHLGDEWRQLGTALGLSEPRIQSILSKCSHSNPAEDMLLHWFRTRPMCSDKVVDMINGMSDIGRTDLVSYLQHKNDEVMVSQLQKEEDKKYASATRILCSSPQALVSWKVLGAQLGLNDKQIADIDSSNERQSMSRLVETVRQNHTSRKRIQHVLEDMQLMDVAERIAWLK